MQPTGIACSVAVPLNFGPVYLGKDNFSLADVRNTPLAIHSSVSMVLKEVSGPAALTLRGSW